MIKSFEIEYSRRLFIFGSTLAYLCGCKIKHDGHPSQSLSELSKYITPPSWATDCNWELVTLPESGPRDIPGPTDYISLIAVLRGNHDLVSGSMPPELLPTIPDDFIRAWLPSSARTAIREINQHRASAVDVSAWIKRKAKKAIAISIPDGIFLYVDYVSP